MMWLFPVLAIALIGFDCLGFGLNDNLTEVLYFEGDVEDSTDENLDDCLDIKDNIEELEKDIETPVQAQEGASSSEMEQIEISEQEVQDILNMIKG